MSGESARNAADGEDQTARRLALLPDGWTVLHHVRWPGRRFASIDHVVIGPGGVFVVDALSWSGSITLAADVLRQNGRSRESTVASCAEAALAVAEVTETAAPHVVPVLCFGQPGPLSGWSGEVMVCTTDNVLEMVLSRPVVMAPEDVARTVGVLEPMERKVPAGASCRDARATADPVAQCVAAGRHGTGRGDAQRRRTAVRPDHRRGAGGRGPAAGRTADRRAGGRRGELLLRRSDRRLSGQGRSVGRSISRPVGRSTSRPVSQGCPDREEGPRHEEGRHGRPEAPLLSAHPPGWSLVRCSSQSFPVLISA